MIWQLIACGAFLVVAELLAWHALMALAGWLSRPWRRR